MGYLQSMEEARKAHGLGAAILTEYDGKELSDETKAQVNAHFDDYDKWKDQADMEKKSEDRTKLLSEVVNKVTRGDGSKGIIAPAGNGGGTTEADIQKAFKKEASIDHLMKGVEHLTPDQKKALSSTTDSSGGYLVDEDFRQELITKRGDLVFMRQRAFTITTTKGEVGFPAFDYDGSPGWIPENANIPAEDITDAFDKQMFTPHKLALLFKMPKELAADAYLNVSNLLTSQFATNFAENEEFAFISGTGSGQPLGLLNAGLPTTPVITSGELVDDDIINMIYAIRAVWRTNGAFMMPRNIVKAVRLIKDLQGRYIWQPGLQAGEPASLAGYTLAETEFMPAVETTSTGGEVLMIFGDFGQYWIVDREDISVQVLMELYAADGQIGYIMEERVDGAPVLKDPFQLLVTK